MRGGAAAKARAPRQSRKRREQQKEDVQSAYYQSPWAGQDPAWWSALGLPPPNSAPWPAEAADGPEAQQTEGPAPGGEGEPDAAQATESLLDALAPGAQQPAAGPAPRGRKSAAKRSSWVVAAARPVTETEAGNGVLTPEDLLGHWVDSQGNCVHVLSMDAYSVRLEATLSRPPRADIHLSVKPVMLGAGWQCGHSLLDPVWTSPSQLHWVAMDGRVSVWVRPQEGPQEETKAPEGAAAEAAAAEGGAAEAAAATGAAEGAAAEAGGAAAAAAPAEPAAGAGA